MNLLHSLHQLLHGVEQAGSQFIHGQPIQATPQLPVTVKKPAPSSYTQGSPLDVNPSINQGSNFNPGYTPLQNSGSGPGGNPQNNSYYDQQQPNQIGVPQYNLNTLINQQSQVPSSVYLNPSTARNDLGLNKVWQPSDFRPVAQPAPRHFYSPVQDVVRRIGGYDL